jgi:hypothetical protein
MMHLYNREKFSKVICASLLSLLFSVVRGARMGREEDPLGNKKLDVFAHIIPYGRRGPPRTGPLKMSQKFKVL